MVSGGNRLMRYGSSEAMLLQDVLHPLTGDGRDYDRLLARIGDARFVLIGEASHGTHEFYRERGMLTRRFIIEKGFDAVAAEADWPDAYRTNRFVRGQGRDANAAEALTDFRRFPTWMWRNTDVLGFVEWLRGHNDMAGDEAAVGFYGLDLYSLNASMDAVLAYLDQVDPAAARRARDRYSCFDHANEDGQAYGYAVSFGLKASCEDEAVAQLIDMRRHSGEVAAAERDDDALFFAEQNARLVANAEQYYRSMFRGRVSSWNLRDSHMMETLEALQEHLSRRRGRPARLVVWAHNSHLGDARATEMHHDGELNLGQLMRQKYRDDVVLIGFSTYSGCVTAASDWGAPAERKEVLAALPGSYERLFHDTGMSRFWLDLAGDGKAGDILRGPRLQRAIGVIYRPQTERLSHYFNAELSRQFDLMLHFDETHAVKPLEFTPIWHGEEVPETFPSGM